MTTPTTKAAELPEALRVPLDSLHADAGYLCGRLLNGSLTQEQVVASIRRRIDAAKLAAQALSAAQAGVPAWINPCDKSQERYLPDIGEAVLFKHEGRVYAGKHTGGSFKSDFPLGKRFGTWDCVWAYPSALDSAAPQPAVAAALAKWGTPPAVAESLEVTEAECEAAVLELEIEDLHTAPQPAVAAGWVMLPGQLPEPGKPVLLDIGKKFPIRAMWAAKHTVEAHDEADPDWTEYDDATDQHYCPQGWYEWNEHEEAHWSVSETPRAWCELPQTIPPAPSTEGESK